MSRGRAAAIYIKSRRIYRSKARRAVLFVHRPAWADGMEWGEAGAEGPHMLMILLFLPPRMDIGVI